MNSFLRLLEGSHTLLSLMILAGAFANLFGTPGFELGGDAELNPLIKLLWPFVLIGGTIFSLRRPKRTLAMLLLRDPLILGLALLALLSFFWSVAPGATLSRSIRLIGFVYFCSYLAARYSWSEFFQLVRWALRLSLLLSILAVIFNPSLGIHSGFHEGSWRGLFTHKNTFGRFGGLLWCVTIAGRNSRLNGFQRLYTFDLLLGAFVLGISDSRTALAVAAAVTSFCLLLSLWQISRANLRTMLATSFGMSLLPGLLGLIWFVTVWLHLDLNDLTTGRVSLWRTILHFALRRPLTGYGYSAFFDEAGFGRVILLAEGWPVPHSHNILIDLFVSMGPLAVVLYLLTMLLMAWRSCRLPGRLHHLPLAVLAFNGLYGLSETGCYPRDELSSLLLIYLALTLPDQGTRPRPGGSSPPSGPEDTTPPILEHRPGGASASPDP